MRWYRTFSDSDCLKLLDGCAIGATEMRLEPWDTLHKVASQMWALGCAVTLTAIWRWNVDRRYPKGMRLRTLQEAIEVHRKTIQEEYDKFKLRYNPITKRSAASLAVATQIARQWRKAAEAVTQHATYTQERVGFFDGGSRGNTGAGGS